MKNYIIRTTVYMDDFKGLKSSHVNNDNLRMITFKRNILISIKENELMQTSGIYFLIDNNGDGNNSIYVGQASNIQRRIAEHIRSGKEFQEVVAFVNKNEEFRCFLLDSNNQVIIFNSSLKISQV